MKATTGKQKEVMRLSRSLRPLGKRDTRWGEVESFVTTSYKRGKTKYWCGECGQAFDSEGTPKECPHCHAKLNGCTETKKHRDSSRNYYVIADVREGWQVLRYFRVDKVSLMGVPANHYHWEVMQLWFSKGEYVCVARQRTMGFNVDSFSYSSKMEIRKPVGSTNGPLTITDIPYSAIKFKKVLPSIQFIENHREAWRTQYRFTRKDLYVLMTAHPMAETLMKAGRADLLDTMLTRGTLSDSYFQAVKIALRNNYDFKNKVWSWLDYIGQLIYLNKDIHNAHYVCPENISEAHEAMGKLVQKKQEKAAATRKLNAEKRRIEREKRFERIYQRTRSKFFGMKLSDGTIEIRVLPNVAAFAEEGEKMGHCVYKCKYYEKKDSLIMSARINGKRIETVEVDLKKYRVIQSQGKCDKPSKYHERILNLVENSMNEIEMFNNKRNSARKVLKVG